jgi:hypothetical protein
MVVFVDLCTGTLKSHWVPEVYGEDGKALEAMFVQSADDLDRLAGGIAGPDTVANVHRLVNEWRRDNPGQWRVEQIRPFVFAATAGRLATEREREATGILHSVQAATQRADQAVLMGERVIFLTHRMPFLLRFQARLGLQQLIQDAIATLGAEDALKHADALRPLMSDASTLATSADEAAKDSRALLEALRPLLEPRKDGQELRAEQLVASANRLVDETRAELRELDRVERVLSSANRLTDRSSSLLQEVRASSSRALIWVAGVGAFLVLLFWAGYVVAHGLTRGGNQDAPGRAPPPKAAVDHALESAHP